MKIIYRKKEYDTEEMSFVELMALAELIQDQADRMQHRIDIREAEFTQAVYQGKHSDDLEAVRVDPVWKVKTQYSIKWRRKEYARLREIAKAVKQLEHDEDRQFAEYFIDVCREKLATERYALLMEEAQSRYAKAVELAQARVDNTEAVYNGLG